MNAIPSNLQPIDSRFRAYNPVPQKLFPIYGYKSD